MDFSRLLQVGVITGFTLILVACGGGSGGGVVAPPVADSFNWTGNTRMTVVAFQGLLANDPAGTLIASADSTTSQGGSVTVDLASGAFVYDPPLGLQNDADAFSYTVAGAAAPAVVTINLVERVWYVRNNATGTNQGTLINPFTSLVQAETAADANDTIFVFAATLNDTGQNAGIALQDGQKLLGEGVGLTVNGVPIVSPFPNAIISNQALAGAAGNTPVVLLDGTTGNEVAGFTIMADFNEGILAVGGSDHDLHDNTIICDAVNGREGIRLLSPSGANRVFGNTINASPRDGIKIVNNEDQAGNPVAAVPVSGTLNIARNIVTSPLQDGIRVELDGSGTSVALHLLTNTVTNPGSGAGDDGIHVNSLGAAMISAVLSQNGISGSSHHAIELQSAGTAGLTSFVANNALSDSTAPSDFLGSVADGSTASACLELFNNGNVAGDASFAVANNATDSGTVELFDAGDNDSAVATVGTVSPVAQNACGVSLDGSHLFMANCSICHFGNGLGNGNVGPNLTNATTAMIELQLINNPTMSFISLTQREISAISVALVPAP